MDPLLWAMLLSLLPISELRGGIPYAIASGIDPMSAFVFCFLANILIIIPLFLFLDFIHENLLRLKVYKKGFDFYTKNIRKRKERVEKAYQTYGIIALSIFVALPLPFTGAWTGTVIAWLLNLKRTKSFFAISLGVLIAGIIVTLITPRALSILSFLIQ
ncbi:MAG: small multi-drug export protein [Candidatus Pacearchaeota archaeon]|nr:small multi-drug export protein [Candidatus Pacearchaeota archaeon]